MADDETKSPGEQTADMRPAGRDSNPDDYGERDYDSDYDDVFDRPAQSEGAAPPPRHAAGAGASRRSPRSLAPDVAGAPGSIAIAQGQIYLIGAILVAQLFLITTALYELLSGRPQSLWWIAGASLVGFVVALVVSLWPRSARDNF